MYHQTSAAVLQIGRTARCIGQRQITVPSNQSNKNCAKKNKKNALSGVFWEYCTYYKYIDNYSVFVCLLSPRP